MQPDALRFPECNGRTVLLAAADAAWRDAARGALVPLRAAAVCAPDPATARALLAGGLRPDLAALDLDAFGAEALALCREIRARDRVRHTPVVLLARDLRPDAVRAALAAGADDCAAPCAPEAFALLVAARFRFAALAPRTAPDVLASGPLVLEQESGRAWVAGEEAGLSPTEASMLSALVRNAGRCLARAELLREMHGEGGGNVRDRTVDTTIVALRRKLGKAGRRIETVRGTGYRWRAEEEERGTGVLRRLLRGGAGALLVALGFALHAGIAESRSHAEFAEPKLHAESAEFAESRSHAESAGVAESGSSAGGAVERSEAEGVSRAEFAGRSAPAARPNPGSATAGDDASIQHSAFSIQHPHLERRVYYVPPVLLAALAQPPAVRVTVVCIPSPLAATTATRGPAAAAAWLETTADGSTWTRRARLSSASLVNSFTAAAPPRDVRVVSDAPGPPPYDIREVVLAD